MAKCFIHGASLIDNNGKQACLKIYRDMDDKELSINFDNSCSAFNDECKRIEACVFTNKIESQPEITLHIGNSQELSDVISNFVKGL